MILYCIIRSKKNLTNHDTYELLERACHERSVEFVVLEADTIDYSKVYDLVVPGSLLYRLAGGERAGLLEALLSDRVVVLRKNITTLMSRHFSWGSAIRLQHEGIPIIPTIFNVTRHDDVRLVSYAESLGGFPIILKSAGGSHGSGVMRLDSIQSLRSVLDFITTDTTADLVMRKYIAQARHLRLIVLGREVIDTIEYHSQPDDFRTNAVAVPMVEPIMGLDPDIMRDAIASVEVLGLEFGGVDILIDNEGQHYVAEVNHPCNFARNQLSSGFDVAGAMVDFLLHKARQAGTT